MLDKVNISIANRHVSARGAVFSLLCQKKIKICPRISRRNLFLRGICHLGNSTRLIYRELSTIESKPTICVRQGGGTELQGSTCKIWKIGKSAFPICTRGEGLGKRVSLRRDKRRNLDELVNWRTLPNKRIRHISLRMNCRGTCFPHFPGYRSEFGSSWANDNAWLAGVALSPRVTIKEDRDESREHSMNVILLGSSIA